MHVEDELSSTWFGSAYNYANFGRFAYALYYYSSPTLYFKLAKEAVILPLAKNYCSTGVQTAVEYGCEATEFAINPAFFIVDKTATAIARRSSKAIKNNLNLEHPEAKALVEVLCREAATQATIYIAPLDNKGKEIQKNSNDNATPNESASPTKPTEASQNGRHGFFKDGMKAKSMRGKLSKSFKHTHRNWHHNRQFAQTKKKFVAEQDEKLMESCIGTRQSLKI